MTLTSKITPKNKRSEKLSLKKDVWKKIFKSLIKICKETKLKQFQFKLIHRMILRKNYTDFVLRRTMNVYTAEIKIQLNTLLSNACLSNCLPKKS